MHQSGTAASDHPSDAHGRYLLLLRTQPHERCRVSDGCAGYFNEPERPQKIPRAIFISFYHRGGQFTNDDSS